MRKRAPGGEQAGARAWGGLVAVDFLEDGRGQPRGVVALGVGFEALRQGRGRVFRQRECLDEPIPRAYEGEAQERVVEFEASGVRGDQCTSPASLARR